MGAPVAITGLAPDTKRSQPAFIAIPGSNRLSSRFSAQNRGAAMSAYVVPDSKTKIPNTVSVSITRNSRLMAITLKRHQAPIVDLEFLPSEPSEPIFVLGSCDTDGVVYLWFLYVAKDALGIDVGLRLLKKYSFFSLRRSTSAYYTRIRLAGNVEDGTMVLVPNDGSNCRVVNFSCEASQPGDTSKTPAIAGSDPVLQLPPPEKPSTMPEEAPLATVEDKSITDKIANNKSVDDKSRTTSNAVAKGLGVGAAAGVAAVGGGIAAATGVGDTISDPIEETTTEKVIAEGLHEDEGPTAVAEAIGTYEPETLVEDAEEGEEYVDAVENLLPPTDEVNKVYAEGLTGTPAPMYAASTEEVRGSGHLPEEFEDVEEVENEEVIAEEVIDDEDEELEEQEEEEYEEYEEPEVEEVYGEGLSNGHGPNYAPPY